MKRSMQMLLVAFGVLSLTLVGCNPDDSTPPVDDPTDTPMIDDSTENPIMDEPTMDDSTENPMTDSSTTDDSMTEGE